MNWNGLDEFLAMGGYGPYVWGAYAVVAGALALEVLVVRRRMRRARSGGRA